MKRQNWRKANALKRVLCGADVQDTIANARLQKPDVDLNEIFSALLYYYERDAIKESDASE
jgi:hypothetical protein